MQSFGRGDGIEVLMIRVSVALTAQQHQSVADASGNLEIYLATELSFFLRLSTREEAIAYLGSWSISQADSCDDLLSLNPNLPYVTWNPTRIPAQNKL